MADRNTDDELALALIVLLAYRRAQKKRRKRRKVKRFHSVGGGQDYGPA
jgi:hypothetical protein